MGAASSVKPASVAPGSQSLIAPYKTSLYGFTEHDENHVSPPESSKSLPWPYPSPLGPSSSPHPSPLSPSSLPHLSQLGSSSPHQSPLGPSSSPHPSPLGPSSSPRQSSMAPLGPSTLIPGAQDLVDARGPDREKSASFPGFFSDQTLTAFPLNVPRNSTISRLESDSSALKTNKISKTTRCDPDLVTDIHSSTLAEPPAFAVPQTLEKLRLINAAAVNGEKSNLLRIVDGDSRLFWLQDDFGRYHSTKGI